MGARSLGNILQDVVDQQTIVPSENPGIPESTEELCEACGGRGWVTHDVPLDHRDFGRLQSCPCKADEIAEGVRRRATERLPEDLRVMTFQSLERSPSMSAEQVGEFAEVVQACKEYSAGGTSAPWLVIAGTLGWGKTHLMAAIANERIEHYPKLGPVGVYVFVPELLRGLQRGYNDGTYDTSLDWYLDTPLLMMDDFGTEYRKKQDDGMSWAEGELYKILGVRYAQRLPTVITTNVAPSRIDPRLSDRMQDVGTGLSNVLNRRLPSFRTGRIVEAKR